MKYLIILTDGAADEPIPELGGKTALQAADMPYINGLAEKGRVGMVTTVPENMKPGSDVANLSVMGYDPAIYHTGRSPLEAASMGIEMSPTDVAFRVNLVTVRDDEGTGNYKDFTIVDHSSGDISNEEAEELINAIQARFGTDKISFYPGVSYRHAMIVHDGSTDYDLTPPHDVLEQKVGPNMPKGEGSSFIADMMEASFPILSAHPVNKARAEKGLNQGNSIWIWGQGRKPALSSFKEKYGVKGAAISAVDLIKGIALCAGMKSIDVEGATGTKLTNYKGKADAAIDAFRDGIDFVYIHLEAPDECSHQGDREGKLQCLYDIDQLVARPVCDYLKSTGEDFRFLVLPDHPTPLRLRTHSRADVPFVYYDSADQQNGEGNTYDEVSGAASGMHFNMGYELTDYFFRK